MAMTETDPGVELVKIGFGMIGAPVLETSPTMIGSIGRTGVSTLIIVGFKTLSAEVTLAEEGGKRVQGIVMTVFVWKSQRGSACPVGETGIDPIGINHEDPVVAKTQGRGQESQFVGTVRTGSVSDFTKESSGGLVVATGILVRSGPFLPLVVIVAGEMKCPRYDDCPRGRAGHRLGVQSPHTF